MKSVLGKKCLKRIEIAIGNLKYSYDTQKASNQLDGTDLIEYEKKFSLLENVTNLKQKIVSQGTNLGKVGNANVAYGEYSFTNPKTGKREVVKYISVSGRDVTNDLVNKGVKDIDGHKIIENPPRSNDDRYFIYTEGSTDSEASLIEHIVKRLHQEFGINLNEMVPKNGTRNLLNLASAWKRKRQTKSVASTMPISRPKS